MIRPIADRNEDEAAWLAARRTGITASDAGKLLTPSGRASILREKMSGVGASLGHIPAVAWGKAREKAVMEWVANRFDIPANSTLWEGESPRHYATPDGLLVEDGEAREAAEVKCSGHAMEPGEYQLQIQWQMHVLGLSRILLVWEQHDGGYPTPKPLGEPKWMWINRDQDLIDQLAKEADALLEGLDSPEPVITSEDEEVTAYALEVLVGREIEAEGKGRKEAAWGKLRALLADRPDNQWESSRTLVTWSTDRPRQTPVVDSEAMEAEAPDVVKAYRDLEAKYTTMKMGEPSRRLTVTNRQEEKER